VKNPCTIGIIGSPGSGKTYLAARFAQHLGARSIFEEEFHFPERIFENLRRGKDLFETIVWFRNKQLDEHNRTIGLANQYPLVVSDSTLYQNQMYIDLYIKDLFSQSILKNLGKLDIQSSEPLSIYIYIRASRQTVRDYLDRKDPSWPLYSEIFFDYLSQMADYAEAFISANQIPNLVKINREDFDFSNIDDFYSLLSQIKRQTGWDLRETTV
jgi:deoxyadenosine/deoxycytidine kinase